MQSLWYTFCLAAVYGFVDGSRARDALKKKNLIKADSKHLMDKRVKLADRGLTEFLQDSVQELTVPENAIDQVHCQVAFPGREPVSFHIVVEKNSNRRL